MCDNMSTNILLAYKCINIDHTARCRDEIHAYLRAGPGMTGKKEGTPPQAINNNITYPNILNTVQAELGSHRIPINLWTVISVNYFVQYQSSNIASGNNINNKRNNKLQLQIITHFCNEPTANIQMKLIDNEVYFRF